MYDNPPKAYFDNNGKPTGFFPAIVNEIAKRENWQINWINGTWDECLTRLNDGTINMMIDVAWSETRAKTYEFNQVAVIENWGTIYCQKNETITTMKDLEDKIIAVMHGNIHTIGDQGIINLTKQANVNCTFIEYGSNEEVFEAIQNKTANAGVTNRLFGLYNQNQYDVRKTPIYFNPVDLKFAFTKNATINANIISKIDNRLIELKEDPQSLYYSAMEDFLLGDPVENLPDWLVWTIWITIGLVVIFFLTSVVLKRKVTQGTIEKREVNRNLEKTNEALFDTIILMQTIPTGVIALDLNGNITITNNIMNNLVNTVYNYRFENGTKIFALEPNEIIDILRQALETTKVKIKEAEINHNSINTQVDHKIIALPNNTFYDVFYSTIFKGAKSNEPNGVLCVFNDVTAFINLEQMRKQFISTVSHELRTPIASINLTLENLIQYHERISPEKKMYMLKLMEKSGKVLAEMIEDLLISSRIDNNKLNLSLQPTDMHNLFDEVLYQLTGKIEEKKVTIMKEFPEQVKMNVDPKRFGQIIRVIIDNAIKYSPPDSEINLEIQMNASRKIKDNTYEGILFRITDHGMGIPAKDLTKLFTRFYRASNVGTIVGTGLGLAIAKELTELHKGQIDIESTEKIGTTFYLIFPNSLLCNP